MDPQLIYLTLALLVIGGFAGFSAGMFGIGGGAIIVPALYFAFGSLGYSEEVIMHAAVATSSATIIVTSLRSAYGHHQHGAVDWQLIWPQNPLFSWGIWIGVGSLVAAAVLAEHLSGNVLTLIFGVVASVIALQLMFGRPDWRLAQKVPVNAVTPPIGFSLGALCSLMGIGFGSFGVTFMLLCGKRIHSAIGTAAALGIFISIPATLGFIVSGQGIAGRPPFSLGYVNTLGFALIAVMSFIFIPLGVKTAHNLSQSKMRLVFGVCLLLVALNMLRKTLL
jgi:uncharacterized membrane protein YfcA